MPTTFGPNQRERHAPRTAGMRAGPRARDPAFAPMIEVIARANREAERKKEPAAAFWGNELTRVRGFASENADFEIF